MVFGCASPERYEYINEFEDEDLETILGEFEDEERIASKETKRSKTNLFNKTYTKNKRKVN